MAGSLAHGGRFREQRGMVVAVVSILTLIVACDLLELAVARRSLAPRRRMLG